MHKVHRKRSQISLSTEGCRAPWTHKALKVQEAAAAKWAEPRRRFSINRTEKLSLGLLFMLPYMEVLDWKLGLFVSVSQTYTTVCISQLTRGLMLPPMFQCSRAAANKVQVNLCVCVCVSFAYIRELHVLWYSDKNTAGNSRSAAAWKARLPRSQKSDVLQTGGHTLIYNPLQLHPH